jgi:hypothetical protein
MLEETNRLTQLVDSLLTMARADAGRIQLHRVDVNLFDLADESVRLLEVLAEEKHQTIQMDGSRSITVIADRTLLRQAIVNLLHNAVKYSPDRSTVQISVRETESSAIVEVQDNGPASRSNIVGASSSAFIESINHVLASRVLRGLVCRSHNGRLRCMQEPSKCNANRAPDPLFGFLCRRMAPPLRTKEVGLFILIKG